MIEPLGVPMVRKSRENPAIRQFILDTVGGHPTDIATFAAGRFQVTRMTINRYLQKLVDEGVLEAEGATKARRYRLRYLINEVVHGGVTPDVQEDAFWRDGVLPHLQDIPKNVLDICQYGITEMVNNVIDHSEGEWFQVMIRKTAKTVALDVLDSGVGIFEKIKRECQLDDARHAILELSKGKLTTDPRRHTGEGIFFTSRMFDSFFILSRDLFYRHYGEDDDAWLTETNRPDRPVNGTMVSMGISLESVRIDTEVFRTYEDAGHTFTKTHVPVRLARYGNEQLVSRSQARRVLSRFNRFSEVMLDFKDIEQIGQAFADEIFRVFRLDHPEIKICWVHSSPQIEGMIAHVSSNVTSPAIAVTPAPSSQDDHASEPELPFADPS